MLLDDPALVDPVDVYPGVNADGVMRICAVPPVPTSGARPRKIERYHLTAQLQRCDLKLYITESESYLPNS